MRLKIKNVNKKYYQRGGHLAGVDIVDAKGEKWKVSRTLGEGKMARVYLVENTHGENRALKAITSGEDSEIRNEIDILQKLSNITHETDSRSNYIVKLLSEPLDVESYLAAEPELKTLFMMEYVNGGDLKTFIETVHDERRSVNLDLVASYFLNMYDGLCFVHEQNIIHCDIKPENFLIGVGGVKLTDFGFAQPWSAAEEAVAPTYKGKGDSKPFLRAGSYFYIAPEICRREGVGKKTDLWALGVCLYELVTLNKPFIFKSATTGQGEALQQLLSSIMNTEPESVMPSQHTGAGGAPEPSRRLRIIQEIINDFLNKTYSKRYSGGTTLVDRLRQLAGLSDEEAEAKAAAEEEAYKDSKVGKNFAMVDMFGEF